MTRRRALVSAIPPRATQDAKSACNARSRAASNFRSPPRKKARLQTCASVPAAAPRILSFVTSYDVTARSSSGVSMPLWRGWTSVFLVSRHSWALH